MEMPSYSEEEHRKTTLRHLFFPDRYAFVSEAVIAFIILIIFNANSLSNRFFSNNVENSNPLSFSLNLIDQTWSDIQQVHLVQQSLIFLLWATVGALVYLLIFRALQIFLGVKQSVGSGVQLVRAKHSAGVMKWLETLHGFFLKALVTVAGIIIFIFGAFICFGIASQELRSGLIYAFPSNIQHLIISFLCSLLSIRLMVLSLVLLSRRFRAWYI